MTEYPQLTPGISLIEVVLVAAIISIIAAIGVPRFSSDIRENKLIETTSKEIVSELRRARQRAISYRDPHYLYIDATARTYALYIIGDNGRIRLTDPVSFDDSIQVVGDQTFGFELNGSASIGMGRSVSLLIGNQAWTITVNSATGQVTRDKTRG